MKKIKISGYFKRPAVFLLCAVIMLSFFASCDEATDGGGGYKEPTGSDTDNGGGSSESDNGGASSGGSENETENENGEGDESDLPTVEFPQVPFD